MGEPAGEDDGRMKPLAKFSSSQRRRASSSGRESEDSGPNEGAVSSLSWILWSPGRCGGSLLASAFEKRFWNSRYSGGVSGASSSTGGSVVALMSVVVGRGGGISMVCACIGRGAQVVVQRGESKSRVYVSQLVVGLWWRSQGIPKTKG